MERLCVVKRADSSSKKITGIIMIIIGVLFFAAALLFGQALLFIGTPVFIMIYIANYYHAEISFDYTYFGTEFKIARIKGDNRRKLLHTIDMENVRMITRADDPVLYNVEKEGSVVKKDYTSKEEGAKIYKIVFSNQGKTFVFDIEPSEDFLDALCEKYSRIITR